MKVVQEQIIAEKHLQLKEGLQFSLKVFATQSEAKENSFTRMVYFRHPERPMIELEFEFSGLECEIMPDKQNTTSHISFQFSESYLQSFSPDDYPFVEINFSRFATQQQFPVCCNTQMILHEVVNSKHKGMMEKIFLESKALSLLLCTHHCYANALPDCSACKFLTKPYEKEKIFRAKEILVQNPDKTITISELSREVGINQCYLKKGFKELFGTTIFDFVQEQRMLKAKMLLTATSTSITEIAYSLGYSNTSNFSNAFKKQTGILPSEFQRN